MKRARHLCPLLFAMCALLSAACLRVPSVPRVPMGPPASLASDVSEWIPRSACKGPGAIPAVAVSLATLTWMIRGLLLAAGAATVCAVLTTSVPFLARLGAAVFGRIAAACAGTALACLALSLVITRVVGILDAHPILVGIIFIGTLLACAGLWAFGHRVCLEKFFHIDFDGSGKIGDEPIGDEPGGQR